MPALNPWRYCGEYFDKETGNIYLRARYYNPSIGRFTQQDPAGDGLNWYTYCNNNPVIFVDPWGLFSQEAYDMYHLFLWQYSAYASSQFNEYMNDYSKMSVPDPDWYYGEWEQLIQMSFPLSKPTSGIGPINISDDTFIRLHKFEHLANTILDHNFTNDISIMDSIIKTINYATTIGNMETYRVDELRICTDGATSSYESKSHQNQTAMSGRLSVDTPADTIPYIVIPLNHPKYADMIGCMGVILDEKTGRYVYAVVGDGGPSGKGFGEVSLKAAWDLGYSKASGAYGPEGDFTIMVFPGTRQSWTTVGLYEQIQAAGKLIFP